MKNIWQFFGLTQENSLFVWNHIKEQFNFFFSKSYSKPFMIICFGVIVVGAIYAGSVVSDLKQDIDARIAQKKIELGNIFDKEAKLMPKYQVKTEGLTSIEQNRLERAMKRVVTEDPLFRPYFTDSAYRELTRIEETSSFQLFTENFGVGWWGVIALVAVFLINILIALIKLPALPHSNLKHARWLSVPIGILLVLWLLKSIWIAFAVGFGIVTFLDRQSIQKKGLNRIAILLIVYLAGFLLLLVATFKVANTYFEDDLFFSIDSYFLLRDITRGL